MNLKFLGQLVQSTENTSWSMLTNGQMKFLLLNIDMIQSICKIQVAHIELLVPKLSK